MKKFYLTLAIAVLSLFLNKGFSQTTFTPYDELPAVSKSEKPAFENYYPDWGKKLYQYPVNLNSITDEFDQYMKEHAGRKDELIRYFRNWRTAVSPYAMSDGTIVLPDLNSLYEDLQKVQFDAGKHLKLQPGDNSNWTFLGPKQTGWLNTADASSNNKVPWQVNVYSFDVAPSDYNVLYCGTETGLVCKTTDKGLNWNLLAQGYPFGGGITAIAIHPKNPDTVYVSAGGQIHKTNNGGKNWTPKRNSPGFSANRLKIDPLNPNRIFASAAEGVFISYNGGSTWDRKWTSSAWDIELKPGSSDTIYALSVNSSGNFTIVMSGNGGNSFSVDSKFPNNIKQHSGGLLAVSANNPNILYAALLASIDNDRVPYIYTGTYANNDWTLEKTKTGQLFSEGDLFGFTTGQGYFDLVLEASPLDANTLFFGTCSLFKSYDGGANFEPIGGYQGDYPIHPDQQDMKMLPNEETWISTDGGMTLTNNDFSGQGGYWSRSNGIAGSDFWGFDQAWNEDLIVGGRYHNGNTAISDYYGNTALRLGGAEAPTGWILKGGKSRHAAFSDLGNGLILPKTAQGLLEGEFLFTKHPNMDDYGASRGNVVTHPRYFSTIYVGNANNIWVSNYFGYKYDLLHSFKNTSKVYFFDISRANPNVMYADVSNEGFYKSSDGGVTWDLKPALATIGGSKMVGRTHFVISPYNENVIYATLSNGYAMMSSAKVFRSTNGGDTWEDWATPKNEYPKCLAIQPTTEGKDLVYFITTINIPTTSKVYTRKDGDSSWSLYTTNYPAFFSVNHALPFFRDSKIRVAGSAGVWESPLAEPVFQPVVTPWVEKHTYVNVTDTIRFDDYSMLNHSGAAWKWTISPTPVYISNANARDPKVVSGAPGNYTVTLSVTQGGQTYSKTITNMVRVTGPPSVEDCGNPAVISKKNWKVVYVDSQETKNSEFASNAIDDNTKTIWHTQYSDINPDPPFHHEIVVDMGLEYNVSKFTYLPEQDGEVTGWVKDFELYFSNDTSTWTNPIKGTFKNISTAQSVDIGIDTPRKGRYFKFRPLSEQNALPWAGAAELSCTGCIAPMGINTQERKTATAFPIPTSSVIKVNLPESDGIGYDYTIISVTGEIAGKGTVKSSDEPVSIDLSSFTDGIYVVRFTNKMGIEYIVKVIKQ